MEQKLPEEKIERVIKTTNPFKDERGIIDNYDLEFPVNMANTITSKAGSVRANHYHPEQLQQVLLVSGKYISVYKDLTNPKSQIKHHLIQAGDLVVTPPIVAHTMIFLEDSIIINLVPGNRDHDKFGVHTIKYELVPESEKERYIQMYKE